MISRVLVTNDDGIAAPGLRHLAHAAARAGHQVVIAAPESEASGASSGLSATYHEHRLAVSPTRVRGLDVEAYQVPASPSYIVVLAALGTFGPPPDIVLSGINRGANAGHAVLHSGTVGAVLTAANQGIPAMAVSLNVLAGAGADPATGGASLAEILKGMDDEALHWPTAGTIAAQLLPQLAHLPDMVVLNVNVPNAPLAEIRGLRQASLAPFGQVQMVIEEAGEGYVRTAVERSGDRTVPGSDLTLLGAGYATVTPIHAIRAASVELELTTPPLVR